MRLDFQQRFELKEAVEMAVGQPVARSIAVQPAQFRGVLQRNNSLRALLTIANVDLPQESDFFVRVFLNKPDADRQTPITDPHYAGSFGFFGGDHSGHQQTSAKPGFIVDVTDTLRRLNQSGEVSAANKVDLQFVPVPLHQPNPAVQRFTAGGLTIGLSSVSSK